MLNVMRYKYDGMYNNDESRKVPGPMRIRLILQIWWHDT